MKHLKSPKGRTDAVIRRPDNIIAETNMQKVKQSSMKIQHIKLKIDQRKPH